MRRVPRWSWLVLAGAIACGAAERSFVPLPPLDDAAVVISLPRRGGAPDLAAASFWTPNGLRATPQIFSLDPGDERLWLVLDEASVRRGLRPRAELGDLSLLRIRPSGGRDCGPGGNEVSYDEQTGSRFRQSLARLAPRVFAIDYDGLALVERDLATDDWLGALELELPAHAEDCGLDPIPMLTPFAEGGLFPESFQLAGQTVARSDRNFTNILDVQPLDSSRYLLVSHSATYLVPRGERFDPEVHAYWLSSQLPATPPTGASWFVRGALVETPGASATQRALLLAVSEGELTSPVRDLLLAEVAIEDGRFGPARVRWRGPEAGLPGPLVRDSSGRIILLGRAGLLVLASGWDEAFRETRLGLEDLMSIAVGENPRFPHVVGARSGALYWGDLFGPTPPNELVLRTPYTVSYLQIGSGAETTKVLGSWRDGRMFELDLATVANVEEFELELPRRAWACAGADELGCGRRPGPRMELGGFALLAGPGPASLLVTIDGCSHPFLLEPAGGCLVSLPSGVPAFGATPRRLLPRVGELQWLSGREGELYSVP